CDELDDVVSKNGFEINAEHKLNYCNDGVGFEVGPMCRCKDPVNNVEIRYNCYGTVPPLCSIAARDPWIELEYFFPLHEVAGDQLLMVSTPGTVEVISMNDLPPEGVIN
ncbi:MAG: hypothetical protein MI919_16325, partial [Holophagales bacterium]|nr:hypothetical protein [Holophagales bacterium]